jgi:hypothetical protein
MWIRAPCPELPSSHNTSARVLLAGCSRSVQVDAECWPSPPTPASHNSQIPGFGVAEADEYLPPRIVRSPMRPRRCSSHRHRPPAVDPRFRQLFRKPHPETLTSPIAVLERASPPRRVHRPRAKTMRVRPAFVVAGGLSGRHHTGIGVDVERDAAKAAPASDGRGVGDSPWCR